MAVAAGLGSMWWHRRPLRRKPLPVRPILITVLVELRSGLSVLAALQSATRRFPDREDLAVLTRVATVSGLDEAISTARGPLKVMVAHLARASANGSSASDAIRRMLDSDLAREKAEKLARTRSLPVQMMLPLSLLLLPGVLLISYGPTLIGLLDDLVAPFG